MKSYHADSGAGLAGLTVKEHDEPILGPHEALVKVRAHSLNAREILVLPGTYPLPVKPDVVMGADSAGEVIAIGPCFSWLKPSGMSTSSIRTESSRGSPRSASSVTQLLAIEQPSAECPGFRGKPTALVVGEAQTPSSELFLQKRGFPPGDSR
jgi:Alcohol dehydrogenase GroES-like domain